MTKSIKTQIEFNIELGDRSQVEVRLDVHAQRNATAVDHQEACGIRLEIEAIRSQLHVDIGKRGQSIAFAETEVQHPGHRDQAKHFDLGLTKHPKQLLVVSQNDGL